MLEDMDRSQLLALARKTLESYFKDGTMPPCPTDREPLRERRGAFVSLHRGEELRGCIGQLWPDRDLSCVVQHCALGAALEDARFAPVRPEELRELDIEISVLGPFRRLEDIGEIEIGRHGLYVVQGRFRGLLLPQVASEYGWDRKEFLEQTSRKAGLPRSAWQDPETSIDIFEAEVFGERKRP